MQGWEKAVHGDGREVGSGHDDDLAQALGLRPAAGATSPFNALILFT
jgi:hypothetical protein